jgi:DedD protein
MALEERLKQRLLGGAVLVALIVIFVPMLIEEPVDQQVVSDHTIPIKPQIKERSIPAAVKVPEESTQTAIPDVISPPVPLVKRPDPHPEPKAIERPGPKPHPSPSAWMVQVASLTNKTNAANLMEKLRKADLPAQVESVNLNGKQHYRVRVGPEVDHRLAEKMLAKIKKDFKLKPTLMRYP